jgi:hypothetical protein
MNTPADTPPTLEDYVTGQALPNVGAEANRQTLERYLIDARGFERGDITVNAPIEVEIEGQHYRSRVDLVVQINGRMLMAIKCAAGSLDSRQREIVAAARLLTDYPIPLAVASDGKDAIVWDTKSNKRKGCGLIAIPSRGQAEKMAAQGRLAPLDEAHRQREAIIFRAYDQDNVNRLQADGQTS